MNAGFEGAIRVEFVWTFADNKLKPNTTHVLHLWTLKTPIVLYRMKRIPTFKSYSCAFHRGGLNNDRIPPLSGVSDTFVNGKHRRRNGVKKSMDIDR